ncbi:MAG: histidine phosphatase family protein [Alphaproteobacteria bacterium]|nr:histidine phosphatase family protein [Alphaproteobacteria bacterium]
MIYLIRHGQTDWNKVHRIQGQLDIPLNNTGRNEALICGKQLAALSIDQIISSDLSRTQETARIIGDILSLSPTTDPRLREVNCGDLQGVLVKDIPDKTWDTFNHEAHKLHAESLADVYKRVKSFFADLDTTKNTLIVTHGGVIRMTLYLSQNPHSFNQTKFENIALPFKIKNTAIFAWDGQEPLHPHLPKSEHPEF